MLAAAFGKVLGAGAYVAELYEQLCQIPQTGVRWNSTTVTRPRAHVMWILWRNLGERYACSSLGEVLGAMAYAGELFELSYQAPQTGVRWNDTTVRRPRAHVSWILRADAVGATR